MRENVNPEDLKDQLQLYGDWLERRSDVALSNERRSAVTQVRYSDGVDPAPIASALGHQGRLDPTGPPQGGWRLLTMAAVVVMVAGVGVLAFANRGDQPGTATVAGEAELSDVITSDDDQVDGDPQRDVLDVAPADDEELSDARTDVNGESGTDDAIGDGSGDDATGTEQGTDANVGQEGGAADSSESTGTESIGSGEADASTADSNGQDASTTTTAQESNDPPTSEAPDPADDESGSGGFTSGSGIAFLAPVHGGTVDLNLGSHFQTSVVDGATSYTFIGAQNGKEVLRATVEQPTFHLPSRLNSLGQGWKFEAGVMTITVIAHNESDQELASTTMQVVLRAGGHTPRLDVGPPGMPTSKLDGDSLPTSKLDGDS